MKPPIFLTLAEVIDIHSNQIELYGGQKGVRDFGLLQSTLAQPEASFAGQWLHEDIFLMTAAYAFHICQNHPFFDGNKRSGEQNISVVIGKRHPERRVDRSERNEKGEAEQDVVNGGHQK